MQKKCGPSLQCSVSINEEDNSMSATSLRTPGAWVSKGSTSIVPPADYWEYLAATVSSRQVEELKQLSDQRLNEFSASALPLPERTAVELLDRVTDDGWLERRHRRRCPNCNFEVSEDEALLSVCPECGEAYSQHGGVTVETIYIRNLAPSRTVDWVVAIHGMNTKGAWQEAFSWHLSTTWGRSVPVAVYKYGIIVAGVVMAWRRSQLEDRLRNKLAILCHEAVKQGFSGKPDVIAHSFGTWLVGHLLEKELMRDSDEQLKFGRIILTGCILRPDFNWGRIKDAGLVEEVVNHWGSKDAIVPLAHATIWDSGPSGRRGFDGKQVLNIRAEGCGHSGLFSIEKRVLNGKSSQGHTGAAGEMSHLEYSYKRYWRPFLTLPESELGGLPDQRDPKEPWRQFAWPLRGTLFQIVALPLVFTLCVLFVAYLGRSLWGVREVPMFIASISAAGLALILAATAITVVWRQLHGSAITNTQNSEF
jgi:hypothetical protein